MPYNVCFLTAIDKNNPDKTYERPFTFYVDYVRGRCCWLVSLWIINFESPDYYCQCCFIDFYDNNSCNENKVWVINLLPKLSNHNKQTLQKKYNYLLYKQSLPKLSLLIKESSFRFRFIFKSNFLRVPLPRRLCGV